MERVREAGQFRRPAGAQAWAAEDEVEGAVGASRSPSRRASPSPSGSRGRSVVDVCRASRDHSVWPCRTSHSSVAEVMAPIIARDRREPFGTSPVS